MRKNLLHILFSASLVMLSGSAMAQSEKLNVANDVSLRRDKANNANATADALELYTTRDNNVITKDFVALMSFDIPNKEGYAVKSATLRLVTERAKGTLAIYALGAEISDADTYNTQKDAVAAARENEPIATQRLKGTDNKAVTDGGASDKLQDWVNEIDLTSYVKTLGSGKCNLLLANAASSTETAIKVYSSDAKDVTNTKANPNFTFKADDLKPQLIVVYEEVAGNKSEVVAPSADTWIRKGNKNSHGSDTTMELCVYDGGEDTSKAKEFLGLMSFEIPSDAVYDNYEIQKASLRLVSERVKGERDMKVYAYPSFEENTIYETEAEKVFAAKNEENLITSFKAKGAPNAMGRDNLSDEYKTVEAWTNEVDLTEYVKSLSEDKFSILLEKANNSESAKFYTKEQKDNVTNEKDKSVVFEAKDLVPQLTVNYQLATYDLTVTDAGAATLVLPFEANKPEGVKAYTLDYTSGDYATAKEVEGNIPENTPVYITAQEGQYTFTATTKLTKKTDEPKKGSLVGVWESTTVPQNAYVLQKQNGKVAFYKVESDNINLKANQAYLIVPANTQTRSIDVNLDGTTGITEVTGVEQNADQSIYTLSGMKVSKTSLKKNQIYISKGKTFIVK